MRAFNEGMNVIRHQAKSMQKKAVFASAFFKEPHNVLNERPPTQTGLTAITANSEKVDALSDVVRSRQACILSVVRDTIRYIS